jgi:N-acetylglucosamine-6-phosphate deacetylase
MDFLPKPTDDGALLSQGGVDLQINGALGVAFNDLTAATAEHIPEICRFLWHQGIDGFLPTLVTASTTDLQRSLSFLQAAITAQQELQPPDQALILGIHLEGPFLEPRKRGAHPAQHLQPLTIERLKALLEDGEQDYTEIVKLVTLAPELDPSGETIQYLRQRGITVSGGHTNADLNQANLALKQGMSMITHTFNAMPPLHHRGAGLLGLALREARVWCGVIADGVHVAPSMVDLVYRLKKFAPHPEYPHPEYNLPALFLVSDALAPLGLPDGAYPWDQRTITVTNGTARLEDGTLSGTTLGLLEAVGHLVQWGICDPAMAIALATTTPRYAIDLPETFRQAKPRLQWHIVDTADGIKLEYSRI